MCKQAPFLIAYIQYIVYCWLIETEKKMFSEKFHIFWGEIDIQIQVMNVLIYFNYLIFYSSKTFRVGKVQRKLEGSIKDPKSYNNLRIYHFLSILACNWLLGIKYAKRTKHQRAILIIYKPSEIKVSFRGLTGIIIFFKHFGKLHLRWDKCCTFKLRLSLG